MSLTFGNVARGVGRIALFIMMWAMSTISFNILLLLFFGIVSMSLVGFDILPPSIPASFDDMHGAVFYVYPITFALAVLIGGYFSAAEVAYTYHKDNEKFAKDVRYVGLVVMWMIQTIFYAFVLSFIITVAFGFYLDIPAEPASNFPVILREARYFLLAALIASGIFAARELEDK